MRIHSLTFSAVGPYPGRHVIDFNQLERTGLYLINGPTGAGKTTIIDCIVYALYGKLSGDESDVSRIRSHFAEPGDVTEVDLVFETAQGVYRVQRSPAYMRPKGRGEGLTEEKAKCKLFAVHSDGSETAVATQVAAASDELERVVGLTRNQFVQTVVLPQGQFATFLRANTADREKVLQSIFKTDLYLKIVELLKQDAKAARQHKTDATRVIREALTRVSGLIGITAELEAELLTLVDNGLDDALFEALDGVAPEITGALESASLAAVAAADAANAADATRAQAAREHAASTALGAAQQQLAAAELRVRSTREALVASTTVALGAAITIDDSEDEPTWRARSSAAAVLLGQLRGLLDAEARVSQWPVERERMLQRIEQLRADQVAQRSDLDGIPSRLAAAQAVVETRPSADEGRDLAERQQSAREARTALDDLADARASLPGMQAAVGTALDEAQSAAAQLLTATTRLREGWAAQMAVDLVPGEPCAVCGSVEHPRPAQSTSDDVSKEQVEASARVNEQAQAALAVAQNQLDQHERLIEQRAAAVSIDVEALQALEAELGQLRVALQQRESVAADADRELARLREEQQRLEKAIGDADVEIGSARAECDTRDTAIAADAAQVDAARAGHERLGARIEAVSELKSALDALSAALGLLATARESVATAQTTLSELPAHDGFGDVEAAESVWRTADAARTDTEQARRLAETRSNALERGRSELEQRCAERAAVIADSADLLELEALFTAGRGAESGLHIYVLQSLFENVVEAANRRFETLLGGRFRLVATEDDNGDGRSRQGLGLSVHDGLTGKSRPAKSLSGGETFCASLALALGLADVVRMTAGGIEIASLFIDEGFGSLDPKPLEDVMHMLHQLSSHGRLVGVISHVPDLKQAIPERIEVRQAEVGKPTTLEVSWMA